MKDHVRFQQVRSKWIREGDTNSSFFHKCVERKGRSRGLKGLRFKGVWVEEVDKVKEKAREHFSSLFSKSEIEYGSLSAALGGCSLRPEQVLALEEKISEEEMRVAG